VQVLNLVYISDNQLDESPFFLAAQSTYNHTVASPNPDSFAPRPRDDEENDDLRGVIDDLTIENKKLKSMLKNVHDRAAPSSVGTDKVLEVRMHGLPAEKKRELEQLLKNFTLGLSGATPSQPASPATFDYQGQSSGRSTSKPPQTPHETSANDSGYASISNSGLNSTGTGVQETFPTSNRNKAVKNYLYDIPNSLLPQQPLTVNEEAKMALVVERLEQLFTGRSAQAGEHSLPIQQQKISHSAARADRRDDVKNHRQAKMEGFREARMLPQDTKMNLDMLEIEHQKEKSSTHQDMQPEPPSAKENSGGEQRPTRPLDLDIHRAQVVEDNIEYIRHLGLSSPKLEEDHAQSQSWLYLNLLASMAQLHTLNVTPAFIRKAVKTMSTQFELSDDGHKIRWKGGNEVARNDQESPEPAIHRGSDDTGDDTGRTSAASTLNDHPMSLSSGKLREIGSSSDNPKLLHSASASTNAYDASLPPVHTKSSTFDYKPIVFKGKRPVKCLSYLDSSSSHGSSSPHSSGLFAGRKRSSIKTKNDSHDGVVTFFSNPHFCTDLSGDKSPINMKRGLYPSSSAILGVSEEQSGMEDNTRDQRACYYNRQGALAEQACWDAVCPVISMSDSDISAAGEDETQPMELPASGIGGVSPEDNFALDVKVERTRTRTQTVKTKGTGTQLPINLSKMQKYAYRISDCKRLSLQPSRLPPPSYVFFTSSSSSSGRGYLEDDSSSSSSSEQESPMPAGFLWQWSSSERDAGLDDGDDFDASPDSGEADVARGQAVGGRVNGQRGDTGSNHNGWEVSGSLAATVGASWSVASVAEDTDSVDSVNAV
jgi:hypothetical protein